MKEESPRELLRWISILDLDLKKYLDRRLVPFNINSSQYFYILKMCESPGMTRNSMFERVYKNPSNITRALDRLESQGYFTKEHDIDKRTYILYPTEKAFALQKKILAAIEDCVREVFSGFSEEEQQSFLAMLKTAGETAHRMNAGVKD